MKTIRYTLFVCLFLPISMMCAAQDIPIVIDDPLLPRGSVEQVSASLGDDELSIHIEDYSGLVLVDIRQSNGTSVLQISPFINGVGIINIPIGTLSPGAYTLYIRTSRKYGGEFQI